MESNNLPPQLGALVGFLESGGTNGLRKFNESMYIRYCSLKDKGRNEIL